LSVRIAAALLLGLAASGDAGASPAEGADDARARAAFDRTKRTDATYALYSWNWVKGAGFETGPHWSAEFHRGRLHRVETPHIRVVADCAAGTGTLLNVATGRSETGPAPARAACGINSNSPIRNLEYLGRVDSRFGKLDRLRIRDAADERLYAVDDSGVLVASEIFPRDPAAGYCVQQEPLAIERSLPAQDMFSRRSLDRSFAATRFEAAPGAPVGDLWLGERRCVGGLD
jgi:hypothetical protein